MFLGIGITPVSTLWYWVLRRPGRVGAFKLTNNTYGILNNDFLA